MLKASRWTLIAGPVDEPITLAEAKAHLRVDLTDDDDLITSLIAAARQHVESQCGRALFTQEWEAHYGGFAADGVLELPIAPLQEVLAVQYVDTAGQLQTLAVSTYEVDAPAGPDAMPGSLILAVNATWPATRAVPNAVRVRFNAGYGDVAADVPEDLRRLLLLLVGNWYENREAVTKNAPGARLEALPFGAEALLDRYRVPEVV